MQIEVHRAPQVQRCFELCGDESGKLSLWLPFSELRTSSHIAVYRADSMRSMLARSAFFVLFVERQFDFLALWLGFLLSM